MELRWNGLNAAAIVADTLMRRIAPSALAAAGLAEAGADLAATPEITSDTIATGAGAHLYLPAAEEAFGQALDLHRGLASRVGNAWTLRMSDDELIVWLIGQDGTNVRSWRNARDQFAGPSLGWAYAATLRCVGSVHLIQDLSDRPMDKVNQLAGTLVRLHNQTMDRILAECPEAEVVFDPDDGAGEEYDPRTATT